MGTVINTNIQALNSQRSLKVVGSQTEKASERLSSGLRINRAGDDAAGLAISEKMRNQIKGLNQASRNSQDGISLIQTAEGALQETHEMLKRMRELIVQGSNDSNTKSDREKIALELNQLTDEIDATADKTEFNSKKLIDGSWSQNELYLHVGANTGQKIEFNISGMDSVSLGVTKEAVGNVVATGVPNMVSKFNLSKSASSSSQDFGVKATADGGSVQISEAGVVSVTDKTGKSTFYSLDGEGNGTSGSKAKNLSELGTIELADGGKVSFDAATKSISLEAKSSTAGVTNLTLDDLNGVELNGGTKITVTGNNVEFSGITKKAVDAEDGVKVATGNYPLQGLEFSSDANGVKTTYAFDSSGAKVAVTTITDVEKGKTYELLDDTDTKIGDIKYDAINSKWIVLPELPASANPFQDADGKSLLSSVVDGTSDALTSTDSFGDVTLTFDSTNGTVVASTTIANTDASTKIAASTDLKALLTAGQFVFDGGTADPPSVLTIDTDGKVAVTDTADISGGIASNTIVSNVTDLKGKSFTDITTGVKISFDGGTGDMTITQTKAALEDLDAAWDGTHKGINIATDDYSGTVEITLANGSDAAFGSVTGLLANPKDFAGGDVKITEGGTPTDVIFADDMSTYTSSAPETVASLNSKTVNAVDDDGNALFTATFATDGVTFTNIQDIVANKTLDDAGFVNDTSYAKEDIATKLDGKTLVDKTGAEYKFTAGKDDSGNTTISIEKTESVDSSEKSNGANISDVLKVVDAAIEKVSTQRAQMGAVQNRLEHTIKNLDTSAENLSSSESRIRDTDMAKEMMEFTKSNVLSQAAQSMLAQANQAPNNILSLLR